MKNIFLVFFLSGILAACSSSSDQSIDDFDGRDGGSNTNGGGSSGGSSSGATASGDKDPNRPSILPLGIYEGSGSISQKLPDYKFHDRDAKINVRVSRNPTDNATVFNINIVPAFMSGNIHRHDAAFHDFNFQVPDSDLIPAINSGGNSVLLDDHHLVDNDSMDINLGNFRPTAQINCLGDLSECMAYIPGMGMQIQGQGQGSSGE